MNERTPVRPEDSVASFEFTASVDRPPILVIRRLGSGRLEVVVSGELKEAAGAFWDALEQEAIERNHVFKVKEII